MKPGTPPLKSARLLDQVQERVRYQHYSLKTEKAYLYWIRFFIRWIAAAFAGTDIRTVQELLGHSDVSATMINGMLLVVCHSCASHGLMMLTPVGWKSATLRVTTVMPCTRAVAAISASRLVSALSRVKPCRTVMALLYTRITRGARCPNRT